MIYTLGELVEHGFKVDAVCVCGHGETVNPKAFADAYGANLPAAAVARAMVCTACGHKGASFVLSGCDLEYHG